MNITVMSSMLSGTVKAIASKSQAHRLLICAAFANKRTSIICLETNKDIEATAECLRALGAQIESTEVGYEVYPISTLPSKAVLNCGESGSTLRFLLPIVGALGVDALFCMQGRLPQRPLSPLWEELTRMGCTLVRESENTLRCTGKLRAGDYAIRGDVSSQFITGLIFATALIPGKSTLTVTGTLQSKPYVDLTYDALRIFGVTQDNHPLPFLSPDIVTVEGDWSNAAFFLTAKALGNDITVTGLSNKSLQGDRAVADILNQLSNFSCISCEDIPDLVPILCIAAAAKCGSVFKGVGRLRLKESDRIASTLAMLHNLGIRAEADENTITVYPGKFHACTIDSANDHRIAMAAAIAATVADGPVTILSAECVSKSYPGFWNTYQSLGGNYEQHIW